MTTTNTYEQAINQNTQTATTTHSSVNNSPSGATSAATTNLNPALVGIQVPVGMQAYAKELEATKQQEAYQQQIGKTVYIPPVAPGSYFAVVKDAIFEANATTRNGKCDRIVVTYVIYVPRTNQVEETVEVKQFYYRSTSKNAPFIWLLTKLLGYDSSEGFRIKDLIGVTCAIDVVHRNRDGNTNIEIADLQKIQLPNIPQVVTI